MRLALALVLFSLALRAADPGVRIVSLSARPDKLSGGDALIAIELPAGFASPVVRLNGADVTAAFRPAAAPRTLQGLVQGLRSGANALQVFGPAASAPAAELALVNHPLHGPVFSGPQEQPFLCQTAQFKLPGGKPLGPPLDEFCSVETNVTYVYRAGDTVKLLPSTTALPDDVAYTTTSLGQKVPYVVRIETGVINRSIYQIAVLHNPVSDPAPSPFAPPPSWNRRLLYSFGGGCVGGWYKQGATLGVPGNPNGAGIVTDSIVGKGYASVGASLNVFGNNCQDLTAAETMAMVKEHFIETFGPPLFTFGRGGSGGSYQQNQIASNYPGLLDGIIPSATFPDVLATIQFLTDAQLLHRYFTGDGAALSDEQKRAIAGVGELKTVAQTAPSARRIAAGGTCPSDLPAAVRYHPVDNPKGARCDVFDHTVNVYGRDPVTGFARRPVDNTGVQYGLSALRSGAISMDQFLDLNQKIGGHDNDGEMSAARSVADPEALRAAYATGRLTSGGGGMAHVPILDSRGYLDLKPTGDIHLKYHSFSLRERLRRSNGSIANTVMLVHGAKAPRGYEAYTFAKMDEWLTNLVAAAPALADRSVDAIAKARPADLVDSCYSDSGERIVEPQTASGGACNKLYPTFPSPHMLAGAPATNDVLKCSLKPVDPADYGVPVTPEQAARLKAIFPNGVCDWTRPGVEQRGLAGPWLSF
jgi:hypothetical protein